MDEYTGIIKPFVGDYAPDGWLLCDGSLVSIQMYQALYTIIGIRYGGDGRTTFGLPDLRARIPLDMGTGPQLTTRNLGNKDGAETVTISPSTFAAHTHVFNGLSGARETTNPANNYLGIAAGNFYCQQNPGDTLLPMNSAAITIAPGGNQPHDNMPPFLVVNYIIYWNGIYPIKP
jgi:microcystin-dependent protein